MSYQLSTQFKHEDSYESERKEFDTEEEALQHASRLPGFRGWQFTEISDPDGEVIYFRERGAK